MRILEPDKRVTLNVNLDSENFSFLAEIADPSTELDIEIAVAKRLNGASLESIPNTVYGYLLAIATLNHVVKEIPESFPHKIKSFEEIRDKEFVVKLFNEYKRKELWFHAELKKNRDTQRGTFRREKHSRPDTHERVQDSSERGNESFESLSGTKEISNRSDVPIRRREIPQENETFVGEETSRGNGSNGIPREYQPSIRKYPRTRGRVYERTNQNSR
ncbi:hypothetical protein [Leptospira sanjuanensis]|uniref:hypothetical protein n=1 Tax=Leptospira sanjuanensis TaxID=2879643 RepID=UPI001EE966A7|nr:hypothetical protein [Leptospira sanjuanensis]MCG6170225.1 hypothetical protein [Leptospira sanjuanensis]